ncbi:hypothetical protein NPIL_511981, partial [Nephila pilipes]
EECIQSIDPLSGNPQTTFSLLFDMSTGESMSLPRQQRPNNNRSYGM